MPERTERSLQECDGCGAICEVGESAPCRDDRCAFVPIDNVTNGSIDGRFAWSIDGDGEVEIDTTSACGDHIYLSRADLYAMGKAMTIARELNDA